MIEPILCVSMEFSEAENDDGEILILEMSDGSFLVADALGVGVYGEGTHNTIPWDEIMSMIAERS